MDLSDDQLLRYSRQIFLPEIDMEGQVKLIKSKVLIIGAGGLGAVSAPILCAAGVGNITLVDDDHVEISNLPRQLAYTSDDVGESKVVCLAARLKQLNPDCEITVISKRLIGEELEKLVSAQDLVLDGTDNFESRHVHNRACCKVKIPLLTAAVTQFSGQLSLFDYLEGTPCYDCLYSSFFAEGEGNNCAENGVLGAASSMVASMQALEATKWLAMGDSAVRYKLLTLDLKSLKWHSAKIVADPECRTCQ